MRRGGPAGLTAVFSDPLTQQLADFVRGIGIDVRQSELGGDTLLPGLDIQGGALVIDETRLAHPGDILHEAGHIAVADPQARMAEPFTADAGDEMATLAWSWAALTHLGLAPEIVFHKDGYQGKGGGASLIENFANGSTIGVPLLQWYGLTLERGPAEERGLPPFPHMIRWVR